MRTLHFLVPAEIDDPAHPSGGNRYDSRLIDGLHALGWSVQEHRITGLWSGHTSDARTIIAEVLQSLHDDAKVLADGLIVQAAMDVFIAESARLRLMGLLHTPPAVGDTVSADALARALLHGMRAIIVTSAWCKRELSHQYGLATEQIAVALPGVDAAALVQGNAGGTRLLCVGTVSALKGHDLLLQALGSLAGLPWRLTCIGPTTHDVDFVQRLHDAADAAGIGDRIDFTGPLAEPELAAAYAQADVLVMASRQESYGMAIIEALARGLPVIAPHVGGIPEALGHGTGGRAPGLLVAPESTDALAAALRRWLTDARLRRQLRLAARQRRIGLTRWAETARRVAAELAQVGS